jgi:pyruvate dehydrogenase E2 component (dihydrolipoamide acetyltransferase)
MSDSVKMPALGESVTEGTVTRWLKQVGDSVELDEPLLEVSTDKVDTEIPSPFAGTLEKILVEEDETVEVGAELAVIGDGSGSGDQGGSQDEAPAEAPQAEAEQPAEQAPAEEPAAEQQTDTTASEATDAPAPQEGGSSGGGGEQVVMPALGESVTEGTVTRWLKQVGDTVEVDEPLLEVSTDKVDTEIPSPVAGTLQEILVQEDETVEVGTALAVVGSGAAPAQEKKAEPEPAQEKAPEPEPAKQEAPAAQPEPQNPEPAAESTKPAEAKDTTVQSSAESSSSAPASASAGTSYLTPLVRKLAAEKGVDTATLEGTGVGGRIRKEDVLAAAEKAAAEKAAAEKPAARAANEGEPSKARRAAAAVPEVSPLRGTTEKASRLRKIIAERMVEALHSQAQLTTVVEVDVTKVARLRAKAKEQFRAREGANLTFLPFFTLAAVEALKAYPKVNGVLEGDTITYHAQENVGIAVDTPRGLLVPVIRDAGDLNLGGIARKIADLATRTRDNKVTPDELGGATFTITNTGSGGALIDTPIVPGGTSAILGTGTIVKRPAVIKDADGEEVIAIRSICYLSLSYDHRLVDGADASRYLTAIKNRIEEGAFESEVGL